MRTLLLMLGCLLSLTACQPELRTIGTVEEEKLITPKTLADMGYEAFREEYLGEEVTLTGFGEDGKGMLIGGYRPQQGQCEVAFRTRDESVNKELLIHIYSNGHPDFVLEDLLKNHDDFNPVLLEYPDEVTLPADICDEWCEYDAETGACFYKSPNLKITGKIFLMNGGDTGSLNVLYMKVKGVSY